MDKDIIRSHASLASVKELALGDPLASQPSRSPLADNSRTLPAKLKGDWSQVL